MRGPSFNSRRDERSCVCDVLAHVHSQAASKQKFVSDWCAAFLVSQPEGGASGIDVLIVLVRHAESIRAACYELLSGLIEASPHALTQQQYKVTLRRIMHGVCAR